MIKVVKKEERIEAIKKKIEKLKSMSHKLGVEIKAKARGPNPLSMMKSKKSLKKSLNVKATKLNSDSF